MQTFPTLKNDLILRAARGEPVERVPVWVMRQAGRYLPEFQEIRKKHEFFEIVQTPELACEITLQPVNRFDLDAAIIFSDILVIPQAMGLEAKMVPGKGPTFNVSLEAPDEIPQKLNLNISPRDSLKYVMEAITLTRHKLQGRVPLLGFSGDPWTLMSYMVEGGGSKTYSKAKKWLYVYPEQSHKLLDCLSNIIVEFLVAQVEAGAQMLQVFDSNAGILSPQQFNTFNLPYLKKIVQSVKSELSLRNIEKVPMTIFAKDAHYALASLKDLGYDVIGLDWTMDPMLARDQAGENVTLQGNLDPCALYAPPEKIKTMVRQMIAKFGTNRYIGNLGHGIYPDVPVEGMQVFVQAVHQESQEIIKP